VGPWRLLSAGFVTAGCSLAATHGGAAPTPTQQTRAHAAAPRAASPPLSKVLGQRIMVGLPGTVASKALLAQVRSGQVGAVILFSYNIASRSQVRALTSSLQSAAKAGGNPPLLIAVDQEGGEVRRFAGGPPYLDPPQMAATGNVSTARLQGVTTGRYLAGVGVNMDLAPVADVPTTRNAFIWQQNRAFSFNPTTVARFSTAFALGLQSAGVAATAKHFPGLGSATLDTDYGFVVLRPSAAQRAAALTPYRTLIPSGVDVVMVSIAAYPAYDPSRAPAALSSRIIGGVLRGQLHFRGVTITDALNGPTGHNEITAGVLAARAGADMLLFIDSAPGELAALTKAVHSGQISTSAALASYQRIVTLKRHLG
jgi:beta-N-acetylhexosaminidase